MEKQEKNTATPYDLDGRPPLKLAIPLGLQHVLAMFVGNLTPLLIITAACGIEPGGDLQVGFNEVALRHNLSINGDSCPVMEFILLELIQ